MLDEVSHCIWSMTTNGQETKWSCAWAVKEGIYGDQEKTPGPYQESPQADP
jgi:hypothetical protein